MQENNENNMLNPQVLACHSNKGLKRLLGDMDERRLQAYRDIHITYKGKKFPRFPRHLDIAVKKKEYWYRVKEVDEWLKMYGVLCDDMEKYGEPRKSLVFFEKD